MATLYAGKGDSVPAHYIEIADELRSANHRVFEVGDRIAAGGNGVVHKCTDMANGIEYAVKFQLNLRGVRVTRFRRECELIRSISHDHLIVYEDHGHIVGAQRKKRKSENVEVPFLIMGLARTTLAELIKNEEVPPEVFVAQFRGLAKALGTLHGQAIHRDIKPDNILIIGEKWVLSDYGLCDPHECTSDERITPDWEVIGPRFWMSPEANNRTMGRGDVINAASDVFQLASVFWFVVNRSHPTGVLSRSDWKGPEALFDPVFKALHHDIAVRPADGESFSSQIDAAVLS